jgi:plastocyanin
MGMRTPAIISTSPPGNFSLLAPVLYATRRGHPPSVAKDVARVETGADLGSVGRKPMSNKAMKTLFAAVLLNAVAVVATGEARAEQRSFTIAAVEPKGSASVDKEPFPTATLPAGAGYSLNKPDQSGRWEIEVYVFMPSQIIVNQGDDVTLNFVGINGASHPTAIAGYNKSFLLKRGEVTSISFKADKAGVFSIDCGTHMPSMRAELIVLRQK